MKKRMIALLLVMALALSAAVFADDTATADVFRIIAEEYPDNDDIRIWVGETLTLKKAGVYAGNHPDYGIGTPRWLISATDDPTDGQVIAAAGTEDVYVLTQQVEGTFYYFYSELRTLVDDPTVTLIGYSNPIRVTTFTPDATLSFTTQPKSVTMAPGETVTLSCLAETSDESPVEYQWFTTDGSGGRQIPGETGAEYTFTSHTEGSYSFYCQAHGADMFLSSHTVTVTVAQAQEPYVFPFTDVRSSDWFRLDVENANKLGLIDGKTSTTFAPADQMTIAEAIKIAACMHQLHNEGRVSLASGSGQWYEVYVNYALENGIIEGAFADYNAEITRRQFVSIFYKALPESEYAPKNQVADGSVPDVAMTDEAANEIYTFYRAGILTGGTDGSFNPESPIVRSEVAAIMSRMLDVSVRK